MKFDAILWDCDGCLIDSEHISCGHMAEVFTEAGYPITMQEFVARFAGQGRSHVTKQLDEAVLKRIDDHAKAKSPLLREKFRTQLKPVANIDEVLDQINLPMAVASGSEMERLAYTLQLTDLYNRFKGRIYSSSMVAHGKPAPDVFLYAAEQLNVDPKNCLVIEDSLNGVRAGVAAGMTVFGFTGGSHVIDKQAHRAELLSLNAHLVFDEMSDLPELMANYQPVQRSAVA